MSVAWVAVGAAVLGTAVTASTANKASKAQQSSASDANALSKEQFDTQVALQEPFRQTGVAANSKLAYLLGLTTPQSTPYTVGSSGGSTAGYSGGSASIINPPSTLVQQADGTYAVSNQPAAAQVPTLDRNALRSQLLAQYTKSIAGSPGTMVYNGENEGAGAIIGYTPASTSVDETGLNAEIERRMNAQAQAQAQAQAAAQAQQAQAQAQAAQQAQAQQAAAQATQQQSATVQQDGTTAAAPPPPPPPPLDQTPGALLRTFSTADLNADPVYQNGLQFGLNEGTKGINRQAAATGSTLSGATLKALTRYGNDYGSTKAADSYNRFTNNQNSIYNKLAGVSGAGQQATNQIGSSSQNYANNASANMIGAGNARAAGYIGSANAINGGIGAAVNGYQNNVLMNKIFPGGGGGSMQAAFGNTGAGSSGFGTGLAYGNQDYGAFV